MLNKISIALLSVFVFVSAPTIVVGDLVGDIAKKAGDAVFSEVERQAIEKYYKVVAPIRGDEHEAIDDDDISDKREKDGRKRDKGKGKGESMRSDLPKGISKKLERGGALPPGLAKRNLPSDLETQLPTTPKGYERIESEGQVLLTDIATGVISDIINISNNPNTEMSKDQSVVELNAPDKVATPEKPETKWWQFWND
jgi:hypothetical protein